MKTTVKHWVRHPSDAPAIVAFAAGVILAAIVLGTVLLLLNQSVELI